MAITHYSKVGQLHIKNATFSKNILEPVHLFTQTDKWKYSFLVLTLEKFLEAEVELEPT